MKKINNKIKVAVLLGLGVISLTSCGLTRNSTSLNPTNPDKIIENIIIEEHLRREEFTAAFYEFFRRGFTAEYKVVHSLYTFNVQIRFVIYYKFAKGIFILVVLIKAHSGIAGFFANIAYINFVATPACKQIGICVYKRFVTAL